MLVNQDDGLWYAKQIVAPNVVCLGFGTTLTKAAQCCAELVIERGKKHVVDRTKGSDTGPE